MFEETSRDDFETIDEEAEYVCPACGERIVVPVDLSAGSSQQYVEDCPVCCRPNRLTVEWTPAGGVTIMSEAE